MAKKSKTQRAKASARRAEKRDALDVALESNNEASSDSSEQEVAPAAKKALAKENASQPVLTKNADSQKARKEPGRIATFLQGVRSEMKRVTWPSRTDVIRWSGVVVGALLFFGVFVFILDNIFPQLLILIDSINTTGA